MQNNKIPPNSNNLDIILRQKMYSEKNEIKGGTLKFLNKTIKKRNIIE